MKEEKNISKSLSENLIKFQNLKEDNMDLVVKKIRLLNKYDGIILYMDSLCDKTIINRDILSPILENIKLNEEIDSNNILSHISERVIATGKVEKIDNEDKISEGLLQGFIILLIDGQDKALSMEVIGGAVRAVELPQMGSSIFSSADAFTENIQTNITLIRRKIRDEKLKTKAVKIGNENKRMVSLLYMDNEDTKNYANKLESKLKEIPDNKFVNLNDISKFIENRKISLFPMAQYVERPDRVCAELHKGKVGIICDESPAVLIYPSTFVEFFSTSDDYYNSKIFKYSIWTLRIMCFWISVLLPGLYIATISFNPEILPVGLSTAIAKSVSMVPFQDVYEIFITIFLVNIIKEACINLPIKLGGMVGIVGGIILGQALISSSMVSAPVVILITCSTIAQLVVPNYKLISTAQILSIFITILGSIFGIFGLVIGLFIILIHLHGLEYLGVDYM